MKVLSVLVACLGLMHAQADDYASAVHRSTDKAVAMYPDTAVEGSVLYKAIDIERIRLERANPSFFDDPDWPLMLAVKVATRLGMKPSSSGDDAAGPDMGPAVTADVLRQFPDLAIPNSALRRGYDSARKWVSENDPSFFNNPEWRILLAKVVMKSLPQTERPGYVPPSHMAKEYALRNDPEALAAYRAQKAREADARAREAEARAISELAEQIRALRLRR